MATDTTVSNLIINKLTKAQYDAIQSPSDTELYLVPDVIDSAPTSGSTNCVESGGVYSALQDKLDAPATAGTSGQVLTSDGQGGQSWQTPSGGGGGAATDVQVNGTSITSNNVANIITNTAYNASSNKIATMSDLPSVPVTDVTVGGISVVTNGVAVVPSIPDVSGKADKVSGATNGDFAGLDANGNLTDSGKKASDFATASDVSAKYTKPSTGIPKTDLASAVQTSLGKADTALQSYTETDPVFTASAAHGISSTDISNWNAKGTYSKPSGGIPKTDLASAVQTSLGKADTALQSYTETDPTVPSWAKQSTKPSYDYSEIGNTPTIPTVPTNVSAFTNDAGYITSSGVVTIYSGSTTPSSSLGSNGDIYIKTT